MKQAIISHFSALENEILNFSTFINENLEEPFKEFKAFDKITSLLENYNFKIEKNLSNIPTAFKAEIGVGHPKVCYICKYPSTSTNSNKFNTDISSSIILASAISLTKIIDEFTNGSLVIIGCPGDNSNGCELTLANDGYFDDVDTVLGINPYIKNTESIKSNAVLPVKVSYAIDKAFVCDSDKSSLPLDAVNLTIEAMKSLSRSSEYKFDISIYSLKNESISSYDTNKYSVYMYIKSSTMSRAEKIEIKLKYIVESIGKFLDIDFLIEYFQIPCKEIISNTLLSRIFKNNLKEIGVIDIDDYDYINTGISLGSLSHIKPCIYPSVNILSNETLHFTSNQFNESSISEKAKEMILNTSKALSYTTIDLFEKPNLINEISQIFFNDIKNFN